MTDPDESGDAIYLDVDHVIDLYAEIFECTVQEAEDQLLSRDGLEGALARPQTYALYQEADLALQAAVLAHGIAEGQHFVEGNKRTALAALLATKPGWSGWSPWTGHSGQGSVSSSGQRLSATSVTIEAVKSSASASEGTLSSSIQVPT